jgi:hypothetical protein
VIGPPHRIVPFLRHYSNPTPLARPIHLFFTLSFTSDPPFYSLTPTD